MILLKDVDLEGWNLIEVTPNTRLWWTKKKYQEGDNGFEFYSVNFASCESDLYNINNVWNDSTEVDVLYHGTALFDGIRHIYLGEMGTDKAGYIHYPNLEVQILIFQELEKLVKQFCPQAD